jgi:hypothetical protein
LTPLEREIQALERRPDNVRSLFHQMVSRGGPRGITIDAAFVHSFGEIVPNDLTEHELRALVSGLAAIDPAQTDVTGVLRSLQRAITALRTRRMTWTLPPIPPAPSADLAMLRMDAPSGSRLRIFPPAGMTPLLPDPTQRDAPTGTVPLLELRF